ncbi:nucleoid-associated protein [Rahnella aceris]
MFRCPECDATYVEVVEKCVECGYEVEIEKIRNNVFLPIAAKTTHFGKDENGKLVSNIGRLWNLENEVSNDFINKIELKFRRKNKFHNFLTKNDTPLSIPVMLKKYIKNEMDFDKIVQAIISKFKREIQDDGRKLSKSSENNIIFIHYKTVADEGDLGRLLIVMLDKKSGFDFEKVVLTPKKLSPIDTDALRQAAMFDLTLFDTTYPENDSESYVKFILGKSTSDFFKDALGCQKEVDNKKSVNEIFRALYDFARDKELSIPIRDKIDEAIKELLDKKSKDKNDKSIKLRDIHKKIDSYIPDEHAAKGQFAVYVNEKEYEIDDVFEPTNRSATNASSIKLVDKNNNFSCLVRKNAIGSESSGKPVKLDRENRCLILPLADNYFDELDKIVPKE